MLQVAELQLKSKTSDLSLWETGTCGVSRDTSAGYHHRVPGESFVSHCSPGGRGSQEMAPCHSLSTWQCQELTGDRRPSSSSHTFSRVFSGAEVTPWFCSGGIRLNWWHSLSKQWQGDQPPTLPVVSPVVPVSGSVHSHSKHPLCHMFVPPSPAPHSSLTYSKTRAGQVIRWHKLSKWDHCSTEIKVTKCDLLFLKPIKFLPISSQFIIPFTPQALFSHLGAELMFNPISLTPFSLCFFFLVLCIDALRQVDSAAEESKGVAGPGGASGRAWFIRF